LKLAMRSLPSFFPRAHWLQIHSTNPLERLNAEIKRRTNVVGIFPNDAAITRLVGAMLLEQNDEWCLNGRYMRSLKACKASAILPRLGCLQFSAEYRASQPFRVHGLTPRHGTRSRRLSDLPTTDLLRVVRHLPEHAARHRSALA
jgi:hypothetical protein